MHRLLWLHLSCRLRFLCDAYGSEASLRKMKQSVRVSASEVLPEKKRLWNRMPKGGLDPTHHVSTARVVYEASLAYGCKKQAYKTFSSLRQICLLRGVQSSLQNTAFWGTYLPTLKCVQNAAKMAASWAKATTRQARCSEKARGDFVLVTPAW